MSTVDRPSPTRFSFHGTEQEYFKIWAVNLLLNIVTLGIYSAWGTVRARSFWLRNLELQGERFDYHVRPEQLLKSRLILASLGALLTLVFFVSPFMALGLSGVVMAAIPWAHWVSLRFHVRHTSYRGIRMGFRAELREFYWVYIQATLLTVLSLGLGLFYAKFLVRKLVMGSMMWGDRKFESGMRGETAFLLILKSFGSLILLYLALVFTMLVPALISTAVLRTWPDMAVVVGVLLGLVSYTLYAGAGLAFYLYSTVQHAVLDFEELELEGGLRLDLKIPSGQNRGLMFSNVGQLILSCGLRFPRASIQRTQLIVKHLEVSGNLEILNETSAANNASRPGLRRKLEESVLSDVISIDLGL